MFFTRCLQIYVKRRHISGKIDIGKVRIHPRVSLQMKIRAVNQLLLERRNLSVIQNAYLTQEEEALYNSEKDAIKQQEQFEQTRAERMFKHKFMEEHLDHLNVTKKWE